MANTEATLGLTKAAPMSGLDVFKELGVSGLQRFGGQLADEFLRELQGDRGRKNMREFAENDPIAGAILFAVRMLAEGVTWTIEPGAQDALHQQQAEFIRGALFEDMSSSWRETLGEILSFLAYGWAYHEVVYKRRGGDVVDPTMRSKFTDGLIGWRKWPLRAQETLDEWVFDENGGIQGLFQDPGMSGTTGGRRFIPIQKALLFRAASDKNNPEGRSILRNGWTSYYFGKRIQITLGIGIERDLAGYPMFQVKTPDPSKNIMVPDIFNPNDTDAKNSLDEFKKIIKSIRRDEQEGMVLPWWIDFKLVTAAGERQFDLDKVLARFDRLKAMTVLADFIFIGHEAVGSKALVSSRLGLFSHALAGFLFRVKDVVNRFAIPALLRLNGMPTDAPPHLEHGPVSEVDLADLGDYISKLSGAGLPLFGDNTADLEKALLARAQLPTTGVLENVLEDGAEPPRRMAREEQQQRQLELEQARLAGGEEEDEDQEDE